MTPLTRVIRRYMEATGPISVADYMELCLGHPDYGYYMTRDPLGTGGDFITAPEISQMFGELIGLWFAQAWLARGRPEQCHMIECGPGRGSLMSDILRVAKMALGFEQSLHIHLVETSPPLIKLQKQNLHASNITWHKDLNSLPKPDQAVPQFFLANEFFDALPIHQLIKTQAGWYERMISWDKGCVDRACGGFVWGLNEGKTDLDILLCPRVMREAETGDIAEVSPASLGVAETMAAHIAKTDGVGLYIDYGHARSATGDSLQAVKAHEYCDCLAHCGEADLTAHVDFQALATAFVGVGCEALPLLEQGVFLKKMGIEARAEQLSATTDNAQQKQNIALALKRLTDDEGMGSLFKLLAVRAPDGPALAGFETSDLKQDKVND